ncbi:unnamed protein product [Brassica rapa]|uniref:Uncharacterized protein n=1 Tax=Brassica campestris TaxID=3711 RepID=A0A3P6CEN1_BRACM|nr:unnamed protein product [Brassica rapa]VDD12458.1 unnamed protein product [Brassica rapa]
MSILLFRFMENFQMEVTPPLSTLVTIILVCKLYNWMIRGSWTSLLIWMLLVRHIGFRGNQNLYRTVEIMSRMYLP